MAHRSPAGGRAPARGGGRGGAALPTLGLLGLLGACERAERTPTPGTELYAVEPDSLRALTVVTAERRLVAYRWRAGEPFQLVVATRGRAGVEHCVAGAPFARWLAALAQVRVDRALPTPRDPADPRWVAVRLEDATRLGPIEARLHVPSDGREPVVVEVGDRQFVTEVRPDVARLGEGGCAALGAPA